MKQDAYGEMYLWNRTMDRLIHVLQRLDAVSIRPKQEMKAYEVRLEEIRAGLNADFTETMARRERDEHEQLQRQRTTWEMEKRNNEEATWKH